jgi:hypothetical protein
LKAGGDFEEMFDTGTSLHAKGVAGEIVGDLMIALKKVGPLDGGNRIGFCDGEELDPIAGGEENDLLQSEVILEAGKKFREVFLRKRDLLENFDRGFVEADSTANKTGSGHEVFPMR